ncbi:nmra-like family [Trichoderma arundinaceum]|uniref:Nmra-like family n=1 Tax=Trichoderma arundinaceum TaxID=490622 RepID=A0A395NV28_TRIAR|nr:nmra-like family [Trichoderma arundinaceum]
MVKVAVAGGTGGLGRTIIDVLEASSEHDYIILSRESKENSPQQNVVYADYSNVDSLTQLLDKHEIHTIISVLLIKTPEQRDAQLNLIRAAEKSSSVKRFTPSEFGPPRKDGGGDPTSELKSSAIAELESSGLEFTLFSHGLFMDYYGLPRIKSYMTHWVFAIDIKNKVAGIPGLGTGQAVYTYSGDVAKFVVATLGLPAGSWKRQSVMIGERRSLNEVLRIAESIRGKFSVHYDSMEDLKSGKITELAPQVAAYELSSKDEFQKRFAHFGIAMEAGAFDFQVPDDGVLLNQVFPDINPKTVEDVIREGWA